MLHCFYAEIVRYPASCPPRRDPCLLLRATGTMYPSLYRSGVKHFKVARQGQPMLDQLSPAKRNLLPERCKSLVVARISCYLTSFLFRIYCLLRRATLPSTERHEILLRQLCHFIHSSQSNRVLCSVRVLCHGPVHAYSSPLVSTIHG